MLLRVFVITVILSIVGPTGGVSAAAPAPGDAASIWVNDIATPTASTTDDTAPPPDTINEFFPEDRSLGDCLSSLPKPGCGSEARGGWRQTLVLIAVLAGIAFIAWRIVAQSRKARR